MVYCMTVYTVALKFGGLSYQVFSLAIKEMWLEYIVVFCLIFFLITNTAKKLALRVINPAHTQPIFFSPGNSVFHCMSDCSGNHFICHTGT